MANSELISSLKDALIQELISDEAIFYAIDSPNITNFSDSYQLMYTHIFPFHKNPETITKTIKSTV